MCGKDTSKVAMDPTGEGSRCIQTAAAVGCMHRPYRAYTVGRSKRMELKDTRIPRMVMRLDDMHGGR